MLHVSAEAQPFFQSSFVELSTSPRNEGHLLVDGDHEDAIVCSKKLSQVD